MKSQASQRWTSLLVGLLPTGALALFCVFVVGGPDLSLLPLAGGLALAAIVVAGFQRLGLRLVWLMAGSAGLAFGSCGTFFVSFERSDAFMVMGAVGFAFGTLTAVLAFFVRLASPRQTTVLPNLTGRRDGREENQDR